MKQLISYRLALVKMSLFISSIVLLGCESRKEIPYSSEEYLTDRCELKLDSGINSIVLGINNFSEVEQQLGRGVRSKKKYKSFTVENIFPNTAHILNYPNLGLSFSTSTQGKLNVSKVAEGLILSSDSPCKTAKGIGIGSTYEDLQVIIGEEFELTPVKDKDGDYTKASFTSPGNNEIFVIFKCLGHKSKSEFKVEEIIMIASKR